MTHAKTYRELMDLREVRNIELFMTDPKIRQGIRRKHRREIESMKFALELEIAAENFQNLATSEMEVPSEVEDAIWEKWMDDDHLAYFDGDDITEFFKTVRQIIGGYAGTSQSNFMKTGIFTLWYGAHGKFVFQTSTKTKEEREEFWASIFDTLDSLLEWYRDEMEDKLADLRDTKYWKDVLRSGSLNADFFRDEIMREIIAPIFEWHKKKKAQLTNKEKKLEQEIARSKNSGHHLNPKFKASLEGAISQIRNAVRHVKATEKETKEFVKKMVDFVVRDLVEPMRQWILGGYVKEWEKYLREASREWFEEHTSRVQSNTSLMIHAAQDMLEPKLSYPQWDFKWDSSGGGAVEMTTGPVDSKDVDKIVADLEMLSRQKFKLSAGHSCHIHIDRGNDFTEFDGVALAILSDDRRITDEIGSDASRYIGVGRSEYLDDWAKPTLNFLSSLVSARSGTKVIDAYSAGQKLHKGKGINMHTASTGYRTIEIRYPSVTMLRNPKNIIGMVDYYLSALTLVKNRNIVMQRLSKDGHWVVAVRSPRAPGGGLVQSVPDLDDLEPQMRELISKYGRELASDVRREYFRWKSQQKETPEDRAKKLSPERYKEFRKRTGK